MTSLAQRRHAVLTARAVLVLAVLTLLELGPRLGWLDALTIIPLSEMVWQVVEFFRGGEIWRHLRATGTMVVASFVLSVATGLVLGYVLWRSPPIYRVVNPYLTSYYALPVFAFYPVLIAVFGFNRVPIILIAWAWAVVAVIVNSVTGFSRIKRSYHKLVRVYGLSRWQAFRRVYFPSAAPFIFNGIKLAVSYSIIGVVASEFILAAEGLGWLVAFHYNNFGLQEMYGAILLIVIITMTITAVVGLAERRLRTTR